MKLTRSSLKLLLKSITDEQPKSMNCEACWEVVDRFAELELAGKDAAQALPLVESHLEHCGRCKEEYIALLEALKNLPD